MEHVKENFELFVEVLSTIVRIVNQDENTKDENWHAF